MSIKVTFEHIQDVTVLRLVGRVTLGEGAWAFREAVREALWAGHKKLALDYGNITYQDSAGFGELVSAFTVTRNAGGRLVLFGLRERVRDALIVTKLFSVFDVFESLDAALAFLNSKRLASIEAQERRYGRVSVLEVQGTLTALSGAQKLADAIGASLAQGMRSFILVCSQILDIDQSGTAILARARDEILGLDGVLVFAEVPDHLIPAITASGAEELFTPRKTLDLALRDFGLEVDHANWRVQAADVR